MTLDPRMADAIALCEWARDGKWDEISEDLVYWHHHELRRLGKTLLSMNAGLLDALEDMGVDPDAVMEKFREGA